MESHNGGINDDVKLDTLNRGIPDQPDAPLISEVIVLPVDVFKSYFTYLLYEKAHFSPVVFTFVALVFVIFLFIITPPHDNKVCDIILLASMVVNFSCFVIELLLMSYMPLCSNAKIKLLLEVIAHKPPVGGVEWKFITYNMNQYLYDQGSWGTPYFFHCESDCYRLFIVNLTAIVFSKRL